MAPADAEATLSGTVQAAFARGAAGAFALKVAGAGLALAVHAALTRTLGSQGYGDFVVGLTVASVLALVAKLGLEGVLLRFVAAYEVQRAWGLLRGVLTFSFATVAISSCVLALGAAAILLALESHLRRDLWAALSLSCALIPLMALGQLRSSALRGLRRVVRADLPEAVLVPTLVLLLLLLADRYLEWASPTPGGAAGTALYVVAGLGAGVLGGVWLLRALPTGSREAAPEYSRGAWVEVARSLFLVSAMHTLLAQTDVLLIGALAGTAEAGLYNVAARISGLALFGLHAANSIVAPLISRYHAQGARESLQALLTLSVRVSFLFAAGTALALFFLAEHVLTLFGEDFLDARAALSVLLVAHLANVGAGSVGFLTMMTGRQEVAARTFAVAAIANILLNALLVPRWGALGAATSTALCTGLWNGLLLLFVRRDMDLNPSILRVGRRAKGG